MSAVVAESLTKHFGEVSALRDASFEVASGVLTAILGPNGAGKTTTMEILEGFLAPSSGRARVLGADPYRAGRAWRSRIGLVLQSTSLDADATVTELLKAFSLSYPSPRPTREVLELVDLADVAGTRVGALSGGQRRRVDLALGVVGSPELLFLDEPTTGLDPEVRRQVWDGITNLNATGTSVILTTHYLEEAEQLADRLLVLSSGRVVADTTPAQLRRHDGRSTLRWRLPPGAAIDSLPAALAAHVDRDRAELTIHTAAVAEALAVLVDFARAQRVDLGDLSVGPPTLEQAYLALVRSDRSPVGLS